MSLALTLLAMLAVAEGAKYSGLFGLPQLGQALQQRKQVLKALAKAKSQGVPIRGRALAACDDVDTEIDIPDGCAAFTALQVADFDSDLNETDSNSTDSDLTFECDPVDVTAGVSEAEKDAICACGGHVNAVVKQITMQTSCAMLVSAQLRVALGGGSAELESQLGQLESQLGTLTGQIESCNYCPAMNTMCMPSDTNSTNSTGAFAVQGCNADGTQVSAASSTTPGSMFLAGALALVMTLGHW